MPPRWEEDLSMQQLCPSVESSLLQAFVEDVVILLHQRRVY